MSAPWAGIAAVGAGAAFGAWARWGLGAAFNAALPQLPLGTLAANLIGGLLIGLVVELFELSGHVPAEWRLAIVTGFLGGLTTFSTFSGESAALLMAGRYGWAALHVGAHVVGSVLLTLFGIWLVRALA